MRTGDWTSTIATSAAEISSFFFRDLALSPQEKAKLRPPLSVTRAAVSDFFSALTSAAE